LSKDIYAENVGVTLVVAHGKHNKIIIIRGRPQGRPLHLNHQIIIMCGLYPQ